MLENSATRRGIVLREPVVRPVIPKRRPRPTGASCSRHLPEADLDDLGLVVVRLHDQQRPDQLAAHPLQAGVSATAADQSRYGWITSCVGVVAAIICALLIDKVGRKRWYAIAFLLAHGAAAGTRLAGRHLRDRGSDPGDATYAILQTITFSLYLYSAELYPTRLRAIGGGFGSAWLRAGSAIGPLVGFIVGDFGIRYVFAAFAAVALVGGLVTLLFAVETKGRVLEELSP